MHIHDIMDWEIKKQKTSGHGESAKMILTIHCDGLGKNCDVE